MEEKKKLNFNPIILITIVKYYNKQLLIIFTITNFRAILFLFQDYNKAPFDQSIPYVCQILGCTCGNWR